MPARDGERYVLVGSGPGSPRLEVETAVSQPALQRGLSGRPSLASGNGMLFIFPRLGRHSMWMPDMHFPIDLVWLNEQLEIVHIQGGLKPCVPGAPCPSYGTERMALYAIEVPAGDVQRLGLRLGQSFRVVVAA
jgi:uncharacterized membrane protein (UPF0127 family)